MPASKSLLILPFLFILALSAFLVEDCAAGAEEATLAIEQAEDVIVSGYQVVLEAEDAGTNVSGLLERLNEAGEFLARARVSYRVGDFDEAIQFADLCSEIGEGVRAEAYDLRDLAIEKAGQRFWWTIIGSIVGAVLIVCLSFVGWLILKRRYYRRLLEMKPEVISNGL